jgi:uncharacterized protein (TIGR02246 family)
VAPESAELAVQAVMDRMVQGYEQRDVDLILSCYEPGASYVTAVGETMVGTNNLRILFGRILAMNPDFDFQSHEIAIAGDLALHISAYESRRSDGTVHRGLSVASLRRQAEGDWLMTIDHPSGDRLLGA